MTVRENAQTPQSTGSSTEPSAPTQHGENDASSASSASSSQADPVATVVVSVEEVPQPSSSTPAETTFPLTELEKLNEMISRPRGVVPVLPRGELEILLEAAIELCKKGKDVECEPCQQFFKEGLTTSFIKVLTDDAVNGWKYEIHKCIFKNTERLIELCVVKLDQDWFPLLDLLALALNPHCRFHVFNSTRPSESAAPGAAVDHLFARPVDTRLPRGWLIDLINRFGDRGGFQILLDRIMKGPRLSVPLVMSLIRPWGQCHEYLTVNTIQRYFLPIVDLLKPFLAQLSDDELKKEAKADGGKQESVSSVLRMLRDLCSHTTAQEENCRELELLRLETILRLLQVSSFGGKMNALNEINRLLVAVSQPRGEEEGSLTASQVADWLRQRHVIELLLRDNLHLPQYCDKIEKLLRFSLKEGAIGPSELDLLWEAQSGKHPAIEKNVHELLAKLAWDMSPAQLEHLFGCFQRSWTGAEKRQREKLLELIRRLAEDDKDGVMAAKVLELLWQLAHSDDLPADTMEQALSAFTKILDYNCAQDKETSKLKWLERLVEEIRTGRWVLPALKQMREILAQFPEAAFGHHGRLYARYRHEAIEELQSKYALTTLVVASLANYMRTVRDIVKEATPSSPDQLVIDGRYSHNEQLSERLLFLKMLLRDSRLLLGLNEAEQVWRVLVLDALFPSDRDHAFRFLGKLFSEEPDLDGNDCEAFFKQHFMSIDPQLVSEAGLRCFERFMKAVNGFARRLHVRRKGVVLVCRPFELLGHEFLWKLLLQGRQETVPRCIDMLIEIYTSLGPEVKRAEVHDEVLSTSVDHLRAAYDTLTVAQQPQAIEKVQRVLALLSAYVRHCDDLFKGERTLLPLRRAFWAQEVALSIRLCIQPRQHEEVEMLLHSNATIGQLRKLVLGLCRDRHLNCAKIDLLLHNEPLEAVNDRRLLGELRLAPGERHQVMAKPSQQPATPESSSDSSPEERGGDGPSENEVSLPGVILSRRHKQLVFLLQLSDLAATIQQWIMRESVRMLLEQLPADQTSVTKFAELCAALAQPSAAPQPLQVDSYFTLQSPSHQWYNVRVAQVLLLPAYELQSDDTLELQCNFLRAKGLAALLSLLLAVEQQQGDPTTRKSLLECIFRMCRFFLLCGLVVTSGRDTGEGDRALAQAAARLATKLNRMPELFPAPTWAHCACAISIAWNACTDDPRGFDETNMTLAREAVQFLSLALRTNPQSLSRFLQDEKTGPFLVCVLLRCGDRLVRHTAAVELFSLAHQPPGNEHAATIMLPLIELLTKHLDAGDANAHEFFWLLQRLLDNARCQKVVLANDQQLLERELAWLLNLETPDQYDEAVLEGRIGIARELIAGLPPDRKRYLGSDPSGPTLIKRLLERFLFPASFFLSQSTTGVGIPPTPICSGSASATAAMELLCALCALCVENLNLLVDTLMALYYSSNEPLTEWEFVPAVGPRPPGGFVGLKNAGATCYMNSVLQQLFLIEPLRNAILSVDGLDQDGELPQPQSEREYHLGVFRQVQVIFAHLAASQLQYHVPRHFWSHFKIGGEAVNVREQHDSVEFFNSVVDSLDEALKALGRAPLCSQVLGGTFADQKICRGCPHRYWREESFTTLSLDIRSHRTLTESLEQYVKGDLLEGANAYRCEHCGGRKVDAVKRMCLRKLPPVLAIQLKRFDYDWERDVAVKSNDFLAFPRVLDVEPYSVAGLARMEGEPLEGEADESNARTIYRLVGVVVHSGQASGGHYYSYILHRVSNKWYKFDDNEVTECPQMDDDQEMEAQCFGGEYQGEMYDHLLKRVAYRKQRRWWNAYILFYEKVDAQQELTRLLEGLRIESSPMPTWINNVVQKGNLDFAHLRTHFSPEYFSFMKRLVASNQTATRFSPHADQITAQTLRLAAAFLFSVGLRAKKALRANTQEWFELLQSYLRHSASHRKWLAESCLLARPQRFAEYLLECPSPEVRSFFAKLLAYLCHLLCADEGASSAESSLSRRLLELVLSLLQRDVCENGRHLQQYFSFFSQYAEHGADEKRQLLLLNVPRLLVVVALEEGPGPPIKYQYADLGRLYASVSTLVRCCDISNRCQSAPNQPQPGPLPNLFAEVQPPLAPLGQEMEELLFDRSAYVKKLLDEHACADDTLRLLQFCCWENMTFSNTVLSELLWQVAYQYSNELRPYLDLLRELLALEDSWQSHRIVSVLRGSDDREGLFAIIHRSRSQQQKRAYQCIKMLVLLFNQCAPAQSVLQKNPDLRKKWCSAVQWLQEELDEHNKKGYGQQYYGGWSHSPQSNETSSNGYLLERSNSARTTLNKALDLCPPDGSEDDDSEADAAPILPRVPRTTSSISMTDMPKEQPKPDSKDGY